MLLSSHPLSSPTSAWEQPDSKGLLFEDCLPFPDLPGPLRDPQRPLGTILQRDLFISLC